LLEFNERPAVELNCPPGVPINVIAATPVELQYGVDGYDAVAAGAVDTVRLAVVIKTAHPPEAPTV
jgi:hypothetical protein